MEDVADDVIDDDVAINDVIDGVRDYVFDGTIEL